MTRSMKAGILAATRETTPPPQGALADDFEGVEVTRGALLSAVLALTELTEEDAANLLSVMIPGVEPQTWKTGRGTFNRKMKYWHDRSVAWSTVKDLLR